MTPAQRITELKTLLAEAKEALMNRDPHTRAKECYDSGHTPCQCTLCRINAALQPEPATGMTRTHNVLGEDVTIEWEKSERIERHDSGCAHFLLIGLGSDGQEYEAVGVYQGDELQDIENIQTI